MRYLTSHFVAPGTKLATFNLRSDPATIPVSSEVPGGRWGATPLYVLTSGRSASAAEEFASHVKRLALGTLVGEITAGAAYRNELYPIAGRYVLSVSIGYPTLPEGGNWGGRGVAPAIAVPSDKAWAAALADAYGKLASSPRGEQQAYRFLAAAQQARVTPAAPALPLAAYAGRFGGDRQVRVEGNTLYSRRGGGPESRLLPISPDRFVPDADPRTQIVFQVRDGRVSGMSVERATGASEAIAKRD